MEEKRAAPRTEVLQSGIVASGGWNTGCTVRNISSHGAAIDVFDASAVPQNFDLKIDGEQLVRSCHIVWTNKNRIGLEFTVTEN